MKTIRNYNEDGEYIEVIRFSGKKIKLKIGHYNTVSDYRDVILKKEDIKSLISDLKYIIGE